jgi:hypothetical protein
VLDHVGVSVPQFCCVIAADNVVVCDTGNVIVAGLTATPVSMHTGCVGFVFFSEPQAETKAERAAAQASAKTGRSFTTGS